MVVFEIIVTETKLHGKSCTKLTLRTTNLSLRNNKRIKKHIKQIKSVVFDTNQVSYEKHYNKPGYMSRQANGVP